jgi:hypothetical protein
VGVAAERDREQVLVLVARLIARGVVDGQELPG